MKNEFLECGKIINKRGINGELKVECYCDSPEAIENAKVLYFDEYGSLPRKAYSIKNYKGFLYIKIEGVTSAEQADALRGKSLFVNRNDVAIEEGKNFIVDLIGLDVKDCSSGKTYGKVKDIINYGASDIYIVTDGKKDYMLPAVPEIIVSVDINSHIIINPIPGIFDDAEEIQ